MSAYYAIRAPRIPGTETHGQIRVHKALAWIHGPGMILTPILGAMAFDQKSKGEKVHGIASRAWGGGDRDSRGVWSFDICPYRLSGERADDVNNEKITDGLCVAALFFLAPSALAQTDSQWVLEQSTLTYHVSHPLHQVDGVSHAARGKGVCHAGQCDFLIAVPVKSFDSGDSNRDLHMLQVTRGGRISDGHRAHSFARRRVRISNDSCRPGGPVCRTDRQVQAGSIPADNPRKRDPDIRNHSGHAVRFQDRPTVAFNACP